MTYWVSVEPIIHTADIKPQPIKISTELILWQADWNLNMFPINISEGDEKQLA